MKVVLIGGAGFLGSHIVDALHRRGDKVTVFDPCLPPSHPTGRSEWLDPAAQLHRVDPRRAPAEFVSSLSDADAVIHLGALTGTAQSMYEVSRYTDVNAGLCSWLAELMIQRVAAPGRVIYTSTRAVYGEGVGLCTEHGRIPLAARTLEALRAGRWDPGCSLCGRLAQPVALREDDPTAPTSPYAMTKLWGEQVLAYASDVTGVPLTVLRLFNVYGPRQSPSNPYVGVVSAFARAALNGDGVELYEDGGIVRDFVFVDDVVDAVVAALVTTAPPRGPLHVGSGIGTTLEELSADLSRIVGRPCPDHRISGRARLGDPRAVTADIARAARELDWCPRTDLLEGLTSTVDWMLRTAVPESETTLEKALGELSQCGLLVGPTA